MMLMYIIAIDVVCIILIMLLSALLSAFGLSFITTSFVVTIIMSVLVGSLMTYFIFIRFTLRIKFNDVDSYISFVDLMDHIVIHDRYTFETKINTIDISQRNIELFIKEIK